MSRYPCSGTYTPGGGGSTGTTASCANTINASVTTYAVPVATLPTARSSGVATTNGDLGANMRLFFVGGYDSSGTWEGTTLDIYNPNDGSVSTITLSFPIPEPTAILQPGWGNYPAFNGFSIGNNTIVVYNVYSPISSALMIDTTTGTVDQLSALFPAWSNPPATFPTYAVVSYDTQYNGLYLIPDDNNNSLQDHFFFDFSTNSWSVLSFNAPFSSGANPLMFTTNSRYGGSDPRGSGPRIYYADTLTFYEFSTYLSGSTPPPDQYYYYTRFGGTDPYAVIDSDGVSYSVDLLGTGLHYTRAAIYDSVGTLTDDGDASIMFGGYRNFGNKYVQEYHYLENLDTLAVSSGDNVITEICPIADALSVIATSYNEETARGAITSSDVPPIVDTTSRPETIFVLYITGGSDPDTGTLNDGTLYAIVTPIKEPRFNF